MADISTQKKDMWNENKYLQFEFWRAKELVQLWPQTLYQLNWNSKSFLSNNKPYPQEFRLQFRVSGKTYLQFWENYFGRIMWMGMVIIKVKVVAIFHMLPWKELF